MKTEDLIPSANLHLDGAGGTLFRRGSSEAEEGYSGTDHFPQNTLGVAN